MTERRKNLLALSLLLAILILIFSKILFTDKIIRAPDIINEYYWSVLDLSKKGFLDFFKLNFNASWDIYGNSGNTLEGGEVGTTFMFLPNLIYYFFPPPASVAWFIVLHFFLGACGVYSYCRLIGIGRIPSLFGALIFAIAPENASLINAGHVLKIATISVAPWAFYFFEKAFRTRRMIFFLTTGLVLAFQFFYTHWQIAYYTCLGIGVYGMARTVGIFLKERGTLRKGALRLVGLNLVTMVFFLSTVAISLVPLASWSTGTNRGAQSGSNQGKGGLSRDEAMSWSLPPEELAGFVIPGFFGLSRQEGGENPTNIDAFYWGRMTFTQTVSYLGLLPWLLLPLPLIFRRDRYTWLALFAVVGGVIFSMGKYSFIYNLLFDYFPGINRFRVPKMMMFMTVLGLSVLSARGLDIFLDEEKRRTKAFRRYAMSVLMLPLLLLAVLGAELAGSKHWISTFYEQLAQPTRFEQGPQLVVQRWNNLVTETGIAAIMAALSGAAIFAYSRKWISVAVLPVMLLLFYLVDVGRVNAKFMFLVDAPQTSKVKTTPVIDYLKRDSKEYRVLPMNADPNFFSSNKIPAMFVSMPVQQRRWQDILDTFSLNSAMPDMLNVKYLVYGREQYLQEKGMLSPKYMPVFTAPDGSQVVLENREVMPKGWLVPSVFVVQDTQQTLQLLQTPGFKPQQVALVETPPPLPLSPPNAPVAASPGEVRVTRYEGERIDISARVLENALLVLGDKYYRGWKATVNGKAVDIYPVNHILRGVYLTPGNHAVEFVFDPLPFKIGKYLTLFSFAFFAVMLGREVWVRRSEGRGTRL